MKKACNTQKLAVAGMVTALYIAAMYVSQSFAFGQFQIRIATALYSTAYLFPFLVLPLGLANALSNPVMGGLGLLDVMGGAAIGILTSGCCALVHRWKAGEWVLIIPITLIPALGASLWLSYLLNVPYWALAASLLVGQCVSGMAGAVLVKALKRFLMK